MRYHNYDICETVAHHMANRPDWALAILLRRTELELTQEDLAAEIEIAQSAYSDIERGKKNPTKSLDMYEFKRLLDTLRWNPQTFEDKTNLTLPFNVVSVGAVTTSIQSWRLTATETKGGVKWKMLKDGVANLPLEKGERLERVRVMFNNQEVRTFLIEPAKKALIGQVILCETDQHKKMVATLKSLGKVVALEDPLGNVFTTSKFKVMGVAKYDLSRLDIVN